MEYVHHKLLEVIGMIQKQFSSNENKNIILVCEYSLFGINLDILNTTTQRCYTHFSNLSLVYVRYLLMAHKTAQCQIFIAQTVLVHHLLSEIRISYLYTW